MKQELTDVAIQMIEGKNFGYLATLSEDGWPHVTPVWVDRVDNYVLVNSSLGRKKVKNASNDSKVAIAVTDSSNPYKWVYIKGKVKDITTRGAEEHIHKLSKKYTGREKYPIAPAEKRVILKIEPLKILSSK